MYAAGRIPGSFFRREGRPSENAILACRLIDRLQNIAIAPEHRGRGYGRALILHLLDRYRGQGVLQVGTGGRTAAFYASCGFEVSPYAEELLRSLLDF